MNLWSRFRWWYICNVSTYPKWLTGIDWSKARRRNAPAKNSK